MYGVLLDIDWLYVNSHMLRWIQLRLMTSFVHCELENGQKVNTCLKTTKNITLKFWNSSQ